MHNFREDDPARCRADAVGGLDAHDSPDRAFSVFDHHHRAVVEVPNALRRRVAGANDFDFEDVTWNRCNPQSDRERVDIDDADAADRRDLLQVRIGGEDAVAISLREFDEQAVHPAAEDIHVELLDTQIHERVGLESLHDFESSLSPSSLASFATIRESLQFIEDERGNREGSIDDPAEPEFLDSTIDEGAGIEEDGERAASLALELDERNDEAEIVPRGQDGAHRDVGEGNREHCLDHRNPDWWWRVQVLWDEFPRVRQHLKQRAERERADQAETNTKIGPEHCCHALVGRHDVNDQHDDADADRGPCDDREVEIGETLARTGPSRDEQHRSRHQQHEETESHDEQDHSPRLLFAQMPLAGMTRARSGLRRRRAAVWWCIFDRGHGMSLHNEFRRLPLLGRSATIIALGVVEDGQARQSGGP